MSEKEENKNSVTFLQSLKTFWLKLKHGNKLQTAGGIKIIGKFPAIKLPGANSKIIIGNKVVLNSDMENSNTALTFKCTLVCGLNGTISIGDNTMLNGVSVTSYEKVSIGKNCQIASSTFISDTDFHPVNSEIRKQQVLGNKYDFNSVNKKAVTIGDNVWIGWGAIILKGVKIGNNSIIAAGSIVLNDVPSNVLVAGNPAEIKKNL